MIEARDAAHAANKAKSNFLATVGHEIRTPMHGILGMLELLESSKLDEAQRETAHLARDSAHSLMGLIDGILDFSKIEADKIEITPSPFDLRKLVRQCVLLYREGASKQGPYRLRPFAIISISGCRRTTAGQPDRAAFEPG